MRIVPPLSVALTALLVAIGCSSGSGPGAPIDPNDPDRGGPNPNENPDPGDPGDLEPGDEDNGPILDPRNLAAPPAPPQITVPPGFTLSIFADGLSGPRHMARRGNEIWVGERGGTRIRVLRDMDGDGYAEEKTNAATNQGQCHGIEYHPRSGWFFIGDTTSIRRFRDDNNDRVADAAPVTIISGLPSGGHNTRTPRVNPYDRKLYVSIGSSCNLCDETNQYRAAIWQYNLDGTGGRMYASGLRNAVGLAFRQNKTMWAVNNGSDDLGNFLPHEAMWKIEDGHYFGWPVAYSDNGVVVRHPSYMAGQYDDEFAATQLADWEFGAHVAPLGMTFWNGKNFGNAAKGDAFVAFHGSWVPTVPVGYEIGLVKFNAAGAPTSFEVVVDNFRIGNNSPVARPVDVLQFGNALLISCDTGNVIYRLDKTG